MAFYKALDDENVEIESSSDLDREFAERILNMSGLEIFMFVYGGEDIMCEATARCLSWLLRHEKELKKDSLYPRLRRHDWNNERGGELFKGRVDAEEEPQIIPRLKKIIADSLEKRGYAAVQMVGRELHEAEHIFVLLTQNGSIKIAHSYANYFGAKTEDFSVEKALAVMSDYSRWNEIFGVKVEYPPTQLYVEVFY